MIFGELVEALTPVTERLGSLGIAHYIGGSVASSLYGAVRATNDVDIATALTRTDMPRFLSGLASSYYFSEEIAELASTAHQSFNLVHLTSALKIDLFCPAATPFQAEAFRRAKPQVLDPRLLRKFFVATPEDIILTKLSWYDRGGRQSTLQMRDLAGILRVQKTLDISYLYRWAPVLGVVDVLETLIPRS